MAKTMKLNDIRNKLTPITTLIDVIESGDVENLTSFVKRAKEVVNELAQSEVYSKSDTEAVDIQIIPTTGKIIPYGVSVKEQNVIKRMAHLRQNEKSPKNSERPLGYRSIAHTLNAEGHRKRNGRIWDAHSVYYILRRIGLLDK